MNMGQRITKYDEMGQHMMKSDENPLIWIHKYDFMIKDDCSDDF